MKKKRIIQGAVAGCLILALCAVGFLRPKSGGVALVNQAGEAVTKATVEINGSKFDFAGIPPGGTRKLKYKVEAGNRYAVSVEFHYDRKLELQTGYFAGAGKAHQLVIKHDGVVLESGEN